MSPLRLIALLSNYLCCLNIAIYFTSLFCFSVPYTVGPLLDFSSVCSSFISSTVGPKLTKVPDRFLVIDEGAVASISCEASSYPPPVVTWSRALGALPRGRSSVNNGVLTIQGFSVGDTGTYICTARNKLGSVIAVTALGIQRKRGNHR